MKNAHDALLADQLGAVTSYFATACPLNAIVAHVFLLSLAKSLLVLQVRAIRRASPVLYRAPSLAGIHVLQIEVGSVA